MRQKVFQWNEHKNWEKWYAWYPVYTKEGYRVWREYVYRRWDGSGYDPEFEYSIKGDIC